MFVFVGLLDNKLLAQSSLTVVVIEIIVTLNSLNYILAL